jgi:hypothetical protein
MSFLHHRIFGGSTIIVQQNRVAVNSGIALTGHYTLVWVSLKELTHTSISV